MSEYTVDSLPEEVLIEIFKLLDASSLKEVVLTCKKFRDIAESSVPWSLKLPHDNCVGTDEPWVETMLDSKRKYVTVSVDGMLDLRKNRTMDIFKKIAPNILTLKLFYVVEEDLQLLLEFLNMLQNMKKLILLEVLSGILLEDIVASDLPSFPKLRELEVIQSEYKMFEFFKKAQLTSLKVMNDPDSDRFQPSSDPLKNLLRTQNGLKKLALRSFNHETSTFFATAIEDENIPFKLKELSLLHTTLNAGDGSNENTNLLKFMKLHCKTIETLELSRRVPGFVFEFVISKFKNLKSLRLEADMIPTDTAFYDRLEINESVKTLTLVDSSDVAIKHLFKHLPNIDHLEITEDCFYDTLKSVAENLKKLKSLKVKSFSGSLFNQLNFPSLKSLSIGCVEDIEWDMFTREAPAITHLHIDNFDDVLEDLNIKKIVRDYKMESLTINCLVMCDHEFFGPVRMYGSSLKSLNLTIESLAEDISEVTDIPGLRFRDDPIIDPLSTGNGAWDEKDYDNRLPSNAHNNWDSADLDAMDPFELQLMYDELGIEDDFDYDDEDDLDHDYNYDDDDADEPLDFVF